MTIPDRPLVTVTGGDHLDVLGTAEPIDRRRSWGPVIASVIGVAGVGVAGTGIALAVALSGGGAQPEDALPADVFGMVKVDLDPAGGQKVAAYELARRFPQLEVDTAGSLKDDLLRRLLKDSGVDYDEQVRPWVGARAAVAALPDADGDGSPEPLIALAYDDRAEAERLLPEVLAQAPEEELTAFAFSDNAPYVLLAPSQEIADSAASAERVLADAPAYRDAVDALDGDQVAVAWGDLGAFWTSLPAEAREGAGAVYGDGFAPTGRFVAGVHLENDAVEIAGRGFDLDFGDEALNAYALGTGATTGLVQELPAGAVAAASVAGLGAQVEAVLDVLATAGFAPGGEEMVALEQQLGIDLPEDLTVLLGEDIALGVYDMDGEPGVGVRTRGEDPDRALEVAQRLLASATEQAGAFGGSGEYTFKQCVQQFPADAGADAEEVCQGLPSSTTPAAPEPVDLGAVAPVEDGVAYATDAELLDRVTGSGGLGDSEIFQRAVPDTDGAATVLFADLGGLLKLFGAEQEGLGALDAVGMTSQSGADGQFRLRLTVRS